MDQGTFQHHVIGHGTPIQTSPDDHARHVAMHQELLDKVIANQELHGNKQFHVEHHDYSGQLLQMADSLESLCHVVSGIIDQMAKPNGVQKIEMDTINVHLNEDFRRLLDGFTEGVTEGLTDVHGGIIESSNKVTEQLALIHNDLRFGLPDSPAVQVDPSRVLFFLASGVWAIFFLLAAATVLGAYFLAR